jgi:hypothetical protein
MQSITRLSNGCTPVNRGPLFRMSDGFEVELLGSSYSDHGSNMTVTYFRPNGGTIKAAKVLAYVNDRGLLHLSFFRHINDNQHYTSRNIVIPKGGEAPEAYRTLYHKLCAVHGSVFGIR